MNHGKATLHDLTVNPVIRESISTPKHELKGRKLFIGKEIQPTEQILEATRHMIIKGGNISIGLFELREHILKTVKRSVVDSIKNTSSPRYTSTIRRKISITSLARTDQLRPKPSKRGAMRIKPSLHIIETFTEHLETISHTRSNSGEKIRRTLGRRGGRRNTSEVAIGRAGGIRGSGGGKGGNDAESQDQHHARKCRQEPFHAIPSLWVRGPDSNQQPSLTKA